MKKIILITLGMFLSTQAWANTISIQPFVSSADVTIAHLESQRTTIQNWANGNVEGGGVNIKAGSINTQDLANTVSPIVRWDEAFNDFTVTGMLPVTSASLTSNISSGVSYVDGFRVSLGTTAHTYTASKDTYVYIHSGGYYVFQEVANGAAAPSTPINTLLLAKVVSSGTALTTVTDSRTTSIQINVTTTNFPANYRSGCIISVDSTTAMHQEPGEIAISNVIYTRTTDTSSKTIATAGNWIGGIAPSLTAPLKTYVYAYNDSGSSWDIKFASNDPVYSDASSNANGVLRYYTTGGTTYRAISWMYISADAVQQYNVGNLSDTGITNRVYRDCTAYSSLGATDIPFDTSIPQSNEGNPVPCLDAVFVPTYPFSKIKIKANLALATSSTASTLAYTLFRNSETGARAATVALSNTTPEMTPLAWSADAGSISAVRFSLRAGSTGGRTTYLNGDSSAGYFGGALISSIEIEEIM